MQTAKQWYWFYFHIGSGEAKDNADGGIRWIGGLNRGKEDRMGGGR